MIDISNVTANIVSQVAFVIMVIMAFRSVAAYIREDWGRFFSQLVMGICCLIVVFFGPQIQNIAHTVGGGLFQ